MSDWWYVIAVVVIVAVVLLYLRARGARAVQRRDARPASGGPARDFRQEREDARVGHMSEEDRTWEAASSERNRETQERRKPS